MVILHELVRDVSSTIESPEKGQKSDMCDRTSF